MKQQYLIGMICPRHHCCDLINAKDSETRLCTEKHTYELLQSKKKYDLVFYTTNLEKYT